MAVVKGQERVLRGGSWIDNGRNVRSANRNANDPANRNANIGFRLAQAQEITGRSRLTRQPSCPWEFAWGEKQMARGMLVGIENNAERLPRAPCSDRRFTL